MPSFFDVDTAEGGFAGEDEGFEGMAEGVEALKFFNDRIGKGNAAGTAVFGFADVGEAIGEVDVAPFEVEDFALTCACCKRKEDNTIEVGASAVAANW